MLRKKRLEVEKLFILAICLTGCIFQLPHIKESQMTKPENKKNLSKLDSPNDNLNDSSPLFHLGLSNIPNESNNTLTPQDIILNVQADGTCVIQGISPRQAQIIALQRARSYAIEKAYGIEMSVSKVVSNGALVLDFIRSYSKGYIIKELVHWHPIRQFQIDRERPPVLEYHVSIQADIFLPKKQPDLTGMVAKLNKSVFTRGERAILTIEIKNKSRIAVFNILANDKILMLHPHPMRSIKTVFPNQSFIMDNLFPEPLQGEKHNVEALFICATTFDVDFQAIFPVDVLMVFSNFFLNYANIADKCTDLLIPYQVYENKYSFLFWEQSRICKISASDLSALKPNAEQKQNLQNF